MFIKKYGSGNKAYAGFHGWSGDHRTFEPIIPFLPQEGTFYSFDLPGCGNSPTPPNWDINTLVDMLIDSLHTISTSNITLIGNCSGAVIGLLVAKKKNNALNRLVLIDPFAYMPWYFSIFLNKYFGLRAYKLTFANPVGRWITNKSLKTKRSEKTDLTKSFEEVNHNTVYKYLHFLNNIGNVEQFKGIRVPVDIIFGKHTFKAVQKSIPAWKDVFPQANVFELEGAGHLPIEETPEQLAKIIFAK